MAKIYETNSTKVRLGAIKSPLNGSRKAYQLGNIFDQYSSINNNLLINDGDKDMVGTAIPYLYNLYSDLIVNPSSVSVSEYQKMVYTQPILAQILTLIKNLIKNDLGEYQHVKKEEQVFIRDMFYRMDRRLETILDDIMTMLYTGYYIGEKKYVSDGRYIYIQDVQPRPAQSLLFRVNSQGALKDDGIIQYFFNNLWTGYSNLLAYSAITGSGQLKPNPYASIGDFDYPLRTVWAQPIGTVILPKNKCVHVVYRGLDGLDNPYGRSLMRSAYDAYLVKTELIRITRNAAKFKSSPTPAIIVDGAQLNTDSGQTPLDDIGVEVGQLGSGVENNPLLLLNGRYGENIWIEQLTAPADLEDLIVVNKYYDNQMLMACLFQADLMGTADKGSYSLGESQKDIMDRNITSISNTIKFAIIDQMVKPMLQINFNEQEDYGSFSKVDIVKSDVALNMDKLQVLREQGLTVKPEALATMLEIDFSSIIPITPQELENIKKITEVMSTGEEPTNKTKTYARVSRNESRGN